MSRDGMGTAQRVACAHAHCLQKPLGKPAIHQKITRGNLVITASVIMTGRFSTACSSVPS
jgi:hypothetical protein